MAYMSPQEYLNSITGGRGGRVTAYQDPREKDPRNILRFTGDWMNRTGAPQGRLDLSGSRAASGTYDPIPIRQTPTASGPSAFQQGLQDVGKTLSDFGQQQPGGVTLPTEQGADSLGPQSMLSKIGGFLTRTPGLGQTLATLGSGIATESDRPGGSAWTGLARGSEAAVQAEQRRRVLERQQQAVERNRAQEDEDRAIQIAAQERVREVIDELGPDATPEERASALLIAATEAAASGNANLANAFVNTASAVAPATPESPFTNWSGATPGHAIKEGDEWVPATADQKGVGGIWERRQNKVTGDVERQFVPTGAAPEEAVGRDDDVGQQTAAAATAGITRLRPFVLDMAGLNRTTGEPVKGIDNIVGLLASTMDQNIGQTDAGWFTRALRAQARRMFNESDIPMVENILSGQLAALQVVNPMVRWLSGAQMTNQETSRYYKALIPSWGDTMKQTRIKMLGMETLALAMSGKGDYLEAIQRLGGLGREIASRQTDDEGKWLEPEEDFQRRLQSYAEGQAAQIYNNMEAYLAEQDARKQAAGPQWGEF